MPEPVPAWRVAAERSVVSRYDAMRSGRATVLVGRESELARIGDRLAAAQAGAGQVVLVVSQPGFGKSRLVEEVHRIAGTEERGRFVLQCSPDQEQTPFFPVIHQLEYAAGIATEDSAGQRYDKLEVLLKRIGAVSLERLATVLDLLRIDASGTPAAQVVKTGNARARTLKALLDLTEAALGRTPVLVVEDVQWADPSTVEFLGMVVDMVRNASALVVATARPEFTATWEDQPHVTVLRLDRLAPAELRRLVQSLAGTEALPPAVVDQIVARSDGVPLFAQELTRGILASGRRQGGAPAIPSTLTESLLARLDGLQHGRETAQLAAVIGREFPIDLLMAVSAEEADAAREGVRRLLEAGIFVRRHSSFGEAAGFNHMLVRDAAYELLLRRDRARLHDKVALALEQQFPEMAKAMPQLVAHHFTEAANHAKAIDYWEWAGADAAVRSSPVEAIAHYEKALEVLAALPVGVAREERELGLRLGMIGPLIAVRGHGSRDVATAVDQALELHRRLEVQSVDRAAAHSEVAGPARRQRLRGAARHSPDDRGEGQERGSGRPPAGASHHGHHSAVSRRARGRRRAVHRLPRDLRCERPRSVVGQGRSNQPCRRLVAGSLGVLHPHGSAGRTRQMAQGAVRSCDGTQPCGQSLPNSRVRGVLDFGNPASLRRIPALCGRTEAPGAAPRSHAVAAPCRPDVGPGGNLSWVECAGIHARAARRRCADRHERLCAQQLDRSVRRCLRCTRAHRGGGSALPVAEVRIEKGERWVAAEFHRLRAKLAAARGGRPGTINADLDEAMAIATKQGAGLLRERAERDLEKWRP